MGSIVAEAGAITFRQNNELKVLLVRSRKEPEHWIFPKGHIESGEKSHDAAERELSEEAGSKGASCFSIGMLSYVYNNMHYEVEYWVLKYTGAAGKGESGREPRWCTINDALKMLYFPDTRELLKKAVEKYKTDLYTE